MPLVRKTSPAQSVALIGDIPDPPDVPGDVIERFTSMEAYQRDAESWWTRFKTLLQRDLDQISTRFKTDETDSATALANLRVSLEALTVIVNELVADESGSIPAQIAALQASLATLTANIAAHIQATAAHGTASSIVGINDQQDLNYKRIGNTIPGYGRFNPLIGVGRILAGASVTVTTNDYMVVTGPYDISGSLVVDGSFAAV